MAFGANFISSWIRIRIRNADPDPGDKFNADPCGSGTLPETVPLKYLFTEIPDRRVCSQSWCGGLKS